MKKIALSVVLASSIALAACGGAATNNTVTDAQNAANAQAANTLEQANEMMAQGQNAMNAGAAQLQDATNQATGAAQDLQNTAAATSNVAGQ